MHKLLICSLLCLVFVCCNKQDKLTEVEAFIENLKEDNTESLRVPDFEVDDIAELLNFRNDQFVTSTFPANPVSSFYMEEVTVGMYVLWTIESVRMEKIEDPNFYLFASSNPRVFTASTGAIVDQKMILPDVANAYFDWWNANLSAEEKLQINPIEDLDLQWN